METIDTLSVHKGLSPSDFQAPIKQVIETHDSKQHDTLGRRGEAHPITPAGNMTNAPAPVLSHTRPQM